MTETSICLFEEKSSVQAQYYQGIYYKKMKNVSLFIHAMFCSYFVWGWDWKDPIDVKALI